MYSWLSIHPVLQSTHPYPHQAYSFRSYSLLKQWSIKYQNTVIRLLNQCILGDGSATKSFIKEKCYQVLKYEKLGFSKTQGVQGTHCKLKLTHSFMYT